jgi:hypothetical protein
MELTLPEFEVAINTARLRIVASAMQRLNHASTYQRDLVKRLDEEVVGACGEMAVGKATGRWFVPSVNTFHRTPDCLKDVEVRATALPTGSLIVRENDADDRRFVLAIVQAPRVTLVGWMTGSEAKQPEFSRDPHGHRQAWFVPQDRLHPITPETLAAWAN